MPQDREDGGKSLKMTYSSKDEYAGRFEKLQSFGLTAGGGAEMNFHGQRSGGKAVKKKKKKRRPGPCKEAPANDPVMKRLERQS